MQQTLIVKPVTFRQFVFLQHRNMLTIAGTVMVALFAIYKIVYPFPDLYFDSYHYLHMAGDLSFITVWPVGYPLFLRFIHFVSPSHYLLVTVQYLLLQVAGLWLLFTLFFIMQPPHWVKVTLLAFLVVNPLTLYLANLISSDILFTILSLVWLTVLLQMIIRVRPWQLWLQGPLLAYIFLVRYQAVYYPVVMLAALYMANTGIAQKLASAFIAFVLLGIIVLGTKSFNAQRYGSDTFSPQSGWMQANNAMYMYPHMQVDEALFQDSSLVAADRFVRRFIQLKKPVWTPADGPQFMLQNGPMWPYMSAVIRKNPGKPVFWYYNRMADDWSRYGNTLVKAYPGAYFRYYLIPNLYTYFFPLQEQFEQYASNKTSMSASAAQWFQLKDNQIAALWPEGAWHMTRFLPLLFFVINIGLLSALLFIGWQKKYMYIDVTSRKCLLLAFLVFSGNAFLLLLAGPIMLRYQAYAITVGFFWWFLLLPYCMLNRQNI